MDPAEPKAPTCYLLALVLQMHRSPLLFAQDFSTIWTKQVDLVRTGVGGGKETSSYSMEQTDALLHCKHSEQILPLAGLEVLDEVSESRSLLQLRFMRLRQGS